MINSSSMTMLTFVFIFQKWFGAIGWSWWTVLLTPWALLFGLIYPSARVRVFARQDSRPCRQATRIVMEPCYKPNEVCEMLQISRTTLYRLIKRGGFPKPIQLSRSTFRWRKSEIDQLVQGDE